MTTIAFEPAAEPAPAPIEPLLTVVDVADILQVNADTVRRYIREQRLDAYALPGYRAGYRVAPSELRRFLAAWHSPETPFGDRQAQHLAKDAEPS